LAQLKGGERERFVEDIKPQLLALKKYNYGKQIAAIEKLIFVGPLAPHRPAAYSPSRNLTQPTVTHTLPIDINSTSPTPLLTTEQNSPQSSSLPSTNASTIDEPSELVTVKTVSADKPTPEVRIETV
jgi:mRNA-binding protein PUF3